MIYVRSYVHMLGVTKEKVINLGRRSRAQKLLGAGRQSAS